MFLFHFAFTETRCVLLGGMWYVRKWEKWLASRALADIQTMAHFGLEECCAISQTLHLLPCTSRLEGFTIFGMKYTIPLISIVPLLNCPQPYPTNWSQGSCLGARAASNPCKVSGAWLSGLGLTITWSLDQLHQALVGSRSAAVGPGLTINWLLDPAMQPPFWADTIQKVQPNFTYSFCKLKTHSLYNKVFTMPSSLPHKTNHSTDYSITSSRRPGHQP